MLAVNSTTMRNNFKYYCDKACDENETIIVTRKNNRNVVVLSIEEYNRLDQQSTNKCSVYQSEPSSQASDISIPTCDLVPNEETLEAFAETERMLNGKIEFDTFNNVDDMFKSLGI